MSSLALGNPVVAYAYKYDAKGSAFNKLFYNILSPGIYNGGGLSFSGNQIIVNSYDALFPYPTTNQLIAVHTSSSINLSTSVELGGYGLGNITSSLPYIAMYFIWTDSEGIYPDYGFYDSSVTTNPSYLVLGKATFSGSSVSGFDYSDSTYPPRYSTTTKGLNVRGLVDSTSTSTGSVVVNGGVGIAKSLVVGSSIAGASTIQGTQLKSTIALGTSPLTVVSSTVVPNLNVDMLDGKHVGVSGNTIPLLDGNNAWSGIQTFNSIPAFNGGTYNTSPFTVSSGFKVTDLNADMIDNYHVAGTDTPNTIALRNDDGFIYGSLAGNATTASNAGYPMYNDYVTFSLDQPQTANSNGFIRIRVQVATYINFQVTVNGITVVDRQRSGYSIAEDAVVPVKKGSSFVAHVNYGYITTASDLAFYPCY